MLLLLPNPSDLLFKSPIADPCSVEDIAFWQLAYSAFDQQTLGTFADLSVESQSSIQ